MHGSVLKPLGTLAVILIAAFATPAYAQDPAVADAGHAWAFDLGAAVWIVPDQSDFILLQLYADRGALHFEARYNYEDLQTGSAWVGWTFSFDGKLSVDITPIAGALLGNTNGLAPGLELDASLGPVELYVESEYVFDLDDSGSNYFYAWTELGVWPVEWASAGLSFQRTQLVESQRDEQWGPYLRLTSGRFGLTGYLLNLDMDNAFGIIQAEFSF
jgi:hypothetical protein